MFGQVVQLHPRFIQRLKHSLSVIPSLSPFCFTEPPQGKFLGGLLQWALLMLPGDCGHRHQLSAENEIETLKELDTLMILRKGFSMDTWGLDGVGRRETGLCLNC